MDAIVVAAIISAIPGLATLVVACIINRKQNETHVMLNSQRSELLDKLASSERGRAVAETKLDQS